jgi:hypothetical protein
MTFALCEISTPAPPEICTVQHRTEAASDRNHGMQGPMHPERVREYDEEFAGGAI